MLSSNSKPIQASGPPMAWCSPYGVIPQVTALKERLGATSPWLNCLNCSCANHWLSDPKICGIGPFMSFVLIVAALLNECAKLEPKMRIQASFVYLSLKTLCVSVCVFVSEVMRKEEETLIEVFMLEKRKVDNEWEQQRLLEIDFLRTREFLYALSSLCIVSLIHIHFFRFTVLTAMNPLLQKAVIPRTLCTEKVSMSITYLHKNNNESKYILRMY